MHEAPKGGREKRPPFARLDPPVIPNQDGVYADKGDVDPRQGKALLRRLAIFALFVAVFAVGPTTALADESAIPTTQALAYNAEWVPYLDPPAKPAAVCLVDSGVNITPDTPADSPDGPILKRLSLDGGPGTAANDTWEGLHGTRMALVGSAPVNDWGTVGFWPAARIVSIRAMALGEPTLPFENYSRALTLCTKYSSELNVAVVNLSLACACEPLESERDRLDDRVVGAHANDMNVVAAAGNSGGRVASPANEPGVLAVAAGDRNGVMCPFSNRGAPVGVTGPGCDIESADPVSGELWSDYGSGTSGASMTVSIALALLRSYRPDLTWQDAEKIVRGSARQFGDSASLDIGAAFRAAGLGPLVDAARTRMPTPVGAAPNELDAPISTLGTTSDVPPRIPLRNRSTRARSVPPPTIRRLVRTTSRLIVYVRHRPVGTWLHTTLQARRTEFGYRTVETVRRAGTSAVIKLPQKWRGGRLVLRNVSTDAARQSSRSIFRAVPR